MTIACGNTTVVVADDHPVVRAGLAALLEGAEGIDVLGMAANGRDACELAVRLKPHVVLMDLSMPVCDGVEATRCILSARPDVRVVVLTSFADGRRVAQAIAAGAAGYLLKGCEGEEIVAAVRLAAAGGAPMDPRAAAALDDTRGLADLTSGKVRCQRFAFWRRRISGSQTADPSSGSDRFTC
jgi:DNA-binding NarL/FixJ family response regulator